MWSFIDFLTTEAREGEFGEILVFYASAVVFIFLMFFLRFMLG